MMASPSETTLIVLARPPASELLRPETAAFWTTVTALGLTITPILAGVGRRLARRVDRRTRARCEGHRRRPHRHLRLWPGRADGRRHAGRARQALSGGRQRRRFSQMLARAKGYEAIFGDVARPRAGRAAQSRRGCGAGADDGRSRAGRPDRAANARQLSRPADHRPGPRHRPRRAALPGRGDRRGARDARGVAPACRSGAGRCRRCDRPGHRQHPRKTRGDARGNHGRRRYGGRAGARPAAVAGLAGRPRPRPWPARREPPAPPLRPCRRRGRRPGPCRDGRRRPARRAPRPQP